MNLAHFSFRQLFSILFILFIGLLAATALQAWTGPTATAPGNNAPTLINTGTTDQVKNAGLSVNALTVYGSEYVQNKLGIGQANPVVPLDVNGTIKIGNSGEVCQAISEGAIRYNSSLNRLEYCDATQWCPFSGCSVDNTSWVNVGSLPSVLSSAQLTVIGDYIYLFGGYINGGANVIYRAPVSNPTSWSNTGATLPVTIRGSQVVIIGDYVYLLGGYTNEAVTGSYSYSGEIYRAPVSNPLSWSDTGATLPNGLVASQAAVIGNYIYLFGGDGTYAVTSVIYRAPVSNPLSWSDTGATLPGVCAWSQVALIGDYVYLFGCSNAYAAASASIYRAPVSSPTSWSDTGATLPAPLYASQLALIGTSIYLFGGAGANDVGSSAIYSAPVSNPTSWSTVANTLPARLGFAQHFILNGYLYILGGYDSTSGVFSAIYRAPLPN